MQKNFLYILIFVILSSIVLGLPEGILIQTSNNIEFGLDNNTINWTTVNANDTVICNITYPNGNILYSTSLANGSIKLIPINLTLLGIYDIVLYSNDTNGNENITTDSFLVNDTIAPVCTFVSVTPADLTSTSTGIMEILLNCTDISGIDQSFMSRTVEGFFIEGLPNLFSIRPPENNKAENSGTNFNSTNIFRAYQRNTGQYWEDLGIFADNYTYAVHGGLNIHTEKTNDSDWTLLNLTWLVEPLAYRTMIYLNRESLEIANKTDFPIYSRNPTLINLWDIDAERNQENYSVRIYLNLAYTGTPNFPLFECYCNSSYNVDDTIRPHQSPNCGFIQAIDTTMIDNITYISRNSSYSNYYHSVINGKIAGVDVTGISYLILDSRSSNYIIRTANTNETRCNVSFNATNVMRTSIDAGKNWIFVAATPDIQVHTINSIDRLELGYFANDTLGNKNHNFTVYTDTMIRGEQNPISLPTILWYWDSVFGKDIFLNETHKGIMNIGIGVAIDPDSVGTVNHTLYLINASNTNQIIYIINNSFYSANDSSLNISFNSSLINNGIYKMNITAVADDNASDIKSYLTYNNFIINSSATLIQKSKTRIEIEQSSLPLLAAMSIISLFCIVAVVGVFIAIFKGDLSTTMLFSTAISIVMITVGVIMFYIVRNILLNLV